MASIRKQAASPFWSIRYRDLESGKWRERTTGLTDARKAQRLADKLTVQEQRIGAVNTSPAFLAWVPGYLAAHWQKENSRRRYITAWQALKMFMAKEDIIYPRQIKYAHGEAYLRWRVSEPVHDRKVGRNTALLELKFLSQLINESIRREFCESNPLLRLGITRTAPKIKPELSDAEIQLLRSKLGSEPGWMRTCFEIALYTGCRFSECEIPMENIDLAAGTIRLRDAKRGENDPRKYFTVPIHKSLQPTLETLKDRSKTCELSRDKNGRINSFFKACGINASFHSLRVTFVTRCHRGGLSESEAMRLVNHSSSLIHRIYSRLNVEDVRLAQSKIPLP